MFRQKIALAISTFVRMGVGLGTLLLMARVLGPRDFGLVATTFGYGSLLGLLTDFGFSVQALRDIGAARERAGTIMAECLHAKGLLTLAVALPAVAAAFALPWPMEERLAVLAILLTVLVGSCADLALVTLRGLGDYWRETRIVVVTSGLHAVVVLGTVAAGGGLIALCAVYLLSRLLYLAAALAAVRGTVPLGAILRGSLARARAKLHGARGYALDSALTVVSGQIDTILISAILGLTATGLYQAGARIVQGALALAVVLAGVHIPSFAAALARRDGTAAPMERRIMLEFVGFGTILAGCLVVLGPLLVRFGLGPAYAPLNDLWPGFAGFLLLRFVAAALGVGLVAANVIAPRVWGQALALALCVALLVFALPRLGVAGAPWLMSAGAAVAVGAYVVGRLRIRPLVPA